MVRHHSNRFYSGLRRAAVVVLVALSLVFFCRPVFPDAGVLIPSGHSTPDPSILSLAEMYIDVKIDNGDARVRVRQIFASHDAAILEGNYIFALPLGAEVSGFAVWHGATRIPGVILERRRARELYSELKAQAIDPGLLQQGEYTAREAQRSAAFSARIVPIEPYGTKRIEIDYHQNIPVENLQSMFAVPLRPQAYQAQNAGRLWIKFELHSELPLQNFEEISKDYPLKISRQDAHFVDGAFEGRNVALTDDFAVRYGLKESQTARLSVITHRNPSPGAPNPTETSPSPKRRQPGFFEASVLLSPPGGADPAPKSTSALPGATVLTGPPRTVLLLFDTSLSMQWDKLERSYRALETILRALRPEDRFNILLFNNGVTPFAPAPVPAQPARINQALSFVRSSDIGGGTNLQAALAAALSQSRQSSGNYLVLLGDGEPTRGQINTGKLESWYATEWKGLAATSRPRTYVFAVGDDANMPLLTALARHDGVVEQVRSTEPIAFKLNAFISKIGRRPVAGLQLSETPAADFSLVYPLANTWFGGSVASWVGKYLRPQTKANFSVTARVNGRPLNAEKTVPLPARELAHDQLPRLWARQRVKALLQKIAMKGEDRATIDEIIRLSKKYKFVTPYTSFLAVPRALLRPRVIPPGDPILRVKADPSIGSIFALFPFGLIKPLCYLKDQNIWETRFLAPPGLADGTYHVRLILRDRDGHVYRESKSFVIISHPPVVRVYLPRHQVRNGQVVELRVAASSYTRYVVAQMEDAPPVELHWNAAAGFNTGELQIPESLPPGKYTLHVTAEDIAHNIGSRNVTLDVVP